jgi:hypothetical protein
MLTTKYWIAEKLSLKPEEVDLLIAKDYARYFSIPKNEKEKIAECVLYHSSKGRVIFGPNSIVCNGLEIKDSGYESLAFREWKRKNLRRVSD